MSNPDLRTNHISLLFGILLIAPIYSPANSPVKSVDADGNITYSDQPIANAKTVTKVSIQEGPTNTEINAAQQQAEKNIKAADKIDKQNAEELEKRKAKQKQYTAKKPAAAESPLQPDVIYTGGSRLTPYISKPRPRAPLNRPGIKPPITIQPIPKNRPRMVR